MAEIVCRARCFFVLLKVFAKHVPCEYVYSHGSLGAFRIFRFFFKVVYKKIFVGVQYAEARSLRFWYLNNGNGACGIFFFVKFKHFRIIHFINMIAGKNQYIFWIIAVYIMNILINCICRTFIPFGFSAFDIRRQNSGTAEAAVHTPRNSVADIVVKLKRLILR